MTNPLDTPAGVQISALLGALYAADLPPAAHKRVQDALDAALRVLTTPEDQDAPTALLRAIDKIRRGRYDHQFPVAADVLRAGALLMARVSGALPRDVFAASPKPDEGAGSALYRALRV